MQIEKSHLVFCFVVILVLGIELRFLGLLDKSLSHLSGPGGFFFDDQLFKGKIYFYLYMCVCVCIYAYASLGGQKTVLDFFGA